MIKKITIFSLCFGLMLLGSSKVFANEIVEEKALQDYLEISPCMSYISRTSCSLDIDSHGQAKIKCYIYGYQGITTNVSIKANLQQYRGGRWVNIKTFRQSSNSHMAALSEMFSVTKGYSYRILAQVKAYNGSSVETRNLISKNIKH